MAINRFGLKTDGSGGFILGDTGVLYNNGALQSLSAPLSRGSALFLTPPDNPKPGISSVSAATHDVANLNRECRSLAPLDRRRANGVETTQVTGREWSSTGRP